MREIKDILKEIWIEATYPRKYEIGKYIVVAKPFSLTITKKTEKK